ncbi:MAG: hypothetical protein HY040_01370 [Planctomycetes bacterium]|nr:hypothetical protein [Planctomycetota bacterium]
MRAGCRRVLIGLVLLALAGCRNKDLVENELRAKDSHFREAVEELGKAESRNGALMREIEALRKGAPITPEQAAQTFGLKRIVLGRGTGGYDNDGLPGDEALQVVIEPRDQDDHTIKTPGTLQILVLEIANQGIKTPLDSWTIDSTKLQKSWKQGLLSTGYNLILPWTNFPRTESLRVIARLVLTDGRVFEADKDIKVRLVPGAPRRMDGMPECPPEGVDPFQLPSGKANDAEKGKVTSASFRPAVAQPNTKWESAPLDDAFRLGRPTSMDAPAPPPELK